MHLNKKSQIRHLRLEDHASRVVPAGFQTPMSNATQV